MRIFQIVGGNAKHRHRGDRARGVDVAAMFSEAEEVGVKPEARDVTLPAG